MVCSRTADRKETLARRGGSRHADCFAILGERTRTHLAGKSRWQRDRNHAGDHRSGFRARDFDQSVLPTRRNRGAAASGRDHRFRWDRACGRCARDFGGLVRPGHPGFLRAGSFAAGRGDSRPNESWSGNAADEARPDRPASGGIFCVAREPSRTAGGARTPTGGIHSASRKSIISPGRQRIVSSIGRQQTEQSSVNTCSLKEVSIKSGNTSPQCGQAMSVST